MKVLCSVRTLFLLTIWAGGIGMILGVILMQSVTPSLHRADTAASVGDAPRAEATSLLTFRWDITFAETAQVQRSR